jgi:hypothetical protein
LVTTPIGGCGFLPIGLIGGGALGRIVSHTSPS